LQKVLFFSPPSTPRTRLLAMHLNITAALHTDPVIQVNHIWNFAFKIL
jgi:hypothetical protein